jgi:SM-20-related protein
VHKVECNDEALAASLHDRGWLTCDGWIEEGLRIQLLDHATRRAALRSAAIGRAGYRQQDEAIRGDRTAWLRESDTPDTAFLARIDQLRATLNRSLFLGLEESEAHYAHYPPGARYTIHRDRFRDDDRRVISAVCYLNPEWRVSDGGVLRLYLDAARERHVDIAPEGGRLVLFLSADFEHEVLPATRDRYSIAAWMRRR